MRDVLKYGTAGVIVIALLVVVVGFLTGAFTIFNVAVDRTVVTQSRQYAETNTDAFYARLEGIKKIDVQISGLDPADPQVGALKSQRELLVSEAKREVAKIPEGSRTPEMFPYLMSREQP